METNLTSAAAVMYSLDCNILTENVSSVASASEHVSTLPDQADSCCFTGVLGLLLFIPCFSLGSGLYGDYPPMHDAGLKMLHDMYLDTKNTTGFWEALQVYRDSSAYRLVASPLPCLLIMGSKLYIY